MQRARDRRSVSRSRWGGLCLVPGWRLSPSRSEARRRCSRRSPGSAQAQTTSPSVPVGRLEPADRPARGRAHEPDDPRPGGLPSSKATAPPTSGPTRAQSVRVLDAGHPVAVHPRLGEEDGPAGVADGLTGVTQLPAGVGLAATFDPSLARQYGQVIGSEEWGKGADVNLGPTDQHRPRPPVGTLVRDLHRGSVPERVAGDERDRRRPEHRRDVPGQALRRLQPGDQPQHAARRRDRRSAALNEIYFPRSRPRSAGATPPR